MKRAAANFGVTEFPRVGTSNRVQSPVAVGLPDNAWVLLPEKCLNAMSQDEFIQVLTHEGAHVIRRDPLIRLLQGISLGMWWWNPLALREELCECWSRQLACSRCAGRYGPRQFK